MMIIVCEYLDLLIAIRKGIRKCTTQHRISNFISFDRLSPSHKVFLCELNPIDIPKIFQEVLRNENWRKAMYEEMRALENIKHGRLLSFLRGRDEFGVSGCSL